MDKHFKSGFGTDFVPMAEEMVCRYVSESAGTKFTGILRDMLDDCMDFPASTSKGRHHAFPGGLMVHCIEVFVGSCWGLVVQGRAKDRPKIRGKDVANSLVAAMLHDYNKLRDIEGRPLYIPNILKSGERSEAKPYSRNKEFLKIEAPTRMEGNEDKKEWAIRSFSQGMASRWVSSIPEGWISAQLVDSLYPGLLDEFDPDVRQAIEIHDGGYSAKMSSHSGKESPLAISLHAADMMSSRGYFGHCRYPIDLEHLRDALPEILPEEFS